MVTTSRRIPRGIAVAIAIVLPFRLAFVILLEWRSG